MVSTPNAPDGLFEKIVREPEDTCLYRRLFLDYTYGLDRIYTRQEIKQAKASPSFEQEYNLKYLGKARQRLPHQRHRSCNSTTIPRRQARC